MEFAQRVVGLDERIVPMLDPRTRYSEWELAGTVGEDSRFLGVLVYGDEITDEDLQRFAHVIDWLVTQGLFNRKRLAPVVGIPLARIGDAPQRWMLLLYGYSPIDRDVLNAMIGCPMIIGEGEIPDPGFPDWADSSVLPPAP